MIIAKRKINAVDSRAIIRSDIGARNRRNTGAIIRSDIGTRNRRNTGARNRRNTKTRRMLMIVDTIRTWTTLPSLHGYAFGDSSALGDGLGECPKDCRRRWGG
jgi:hypothetical protein